LKKKTATSPGYSIANAEAVEKALAPESLLLCEVRGKVFNL
jgi:hypothetical protein